MIGFRSGGLGAASAPRRRVNMLRRRVATILSVALLVFLMTWQAPLRQSKVSIKIDAASPIERR